MTREQLAAHIKARHGRTAPGVYGAAGLKRFHDHLHRTYALDHDVEDVER